LVAGADVLVMPSRYEPCGIVQLYAQRYGVVPVVRRTGGLVDTVLDARRDSSGTGFLFDALDPGELAAAVTVALAALRSPTGEELRRRAARRAVGWDYPAARYLAIYRDGAARG
ncbi:MAG: glycosyltransferase, partial [Myxococcales bacterium]|nr:glycosyltransferase [Myxococcales bacterium]